MTDTHLERCAVCGGTREEHNTGTKHMFTTNPGELKLPPKVENKVNKEATKTQDERESRDPALYAVSILIEHLVDNGTITPEQGLSCFGVKLGKPEPSEVVDVD